MSTESKGPASPTPEASPGEGKGCLIAILFLFGPILIGVIYSLLK
ncbi:hypothetical protein [Aeoliella mucimassa]|uniref:Uncharacterized protein n=1 Tax=Aeoliella mucimassa TaxID=2527972 RepID=A0A518AJU6_9BACT|nr:hypothetical protein [Aeoliella mucimassa]QDU55011.1 hypothetical protein Pan181_11960 [Aeoliella mucimassa]